MVATLSSVTGTATQVVEQLQELLSSMQVFADAGDWQKVQASVGKIQSLVEQVPAERRRDVLLDAGRRIDRICQAASYARNEVVEKLTSIRQGRKATASYRAAGGLR
jgi:hypothetical protein